MENKEEIKINNVPSNNSFEIIDNTPKTENKNTKFNSYEILPEGNDSDDDLPILDEDGTSILKVPQNSPAHNYTESYSTKKVQIQNLMTEFKKTNSSNSRRDFKCLERHLEKLDDSEKKNIAFAEFKNKMVDTAKNDKNMNAVLKKLYA
jgi:hypothetical protein